MEDAGKSNHTDDLEKIDEEITDDDLEEIAGGTIHTSIRLCENCHKRIAVHQMKLCAACYLESK